MVVVDGGTTNQGFLLELLDRPELRGRRGRHHLARPAAAQRRDRGRPRHADVALVQAAIELARRRGRRSSARASTRFARRGRPQADAELGAHGRAAPPRPGLPLRRQPGRSGALPGRGRRRRASRRRSSVLSAHERRLAIRGRTLPHASSPCRDADLLVEVDGVPHRVSRDDGGLVRSLAPGRGRLDPGRAGRRGGAPATWWPWWRA